MFFRIKIRLRVRVRISFIVRVDFKVLDVRLTVVYECDGERQHPFIVRFFV